MRTHYELGVALYETGDLKGAAQRFAVVAAVRLVAAGRTVTPASALDPGYGANIS
jgi:hypothetical protein